MSLERFHQAQANRGSGYSDALREMRSGRKRSHWIWYIFPQLEGLGHSSSAEYYAIRGMEEAMAYLRDPVLRQHYREISSAVEQQILKNGVPVEVLMSGSTDALKLVSSLTLFRAAAARLAAAGDDFELAQLIQTCDRLLDQTTAHGYPRCRFTLSQIE